MLHVLLMEYQNKNQHSISTQYKMHKAILLYYITMHSMLYIPPLPVSFPLLLLAMEQEKNKLEHKFQPQKKNIILTLVSL